MSKNLCIIQARVGSTRLPKKVLKEIDGISLLEYEVQRVRLAKKIDKIVIATTINQEDDEIQNLCQKIGVDCFRGSIDDVLDRYFQCSSNYPEYSNIVRLTGDCPLVDPVIIDQVVDFFEQGGYDYASNVLKETFPDGMDVEIFKKEVLKQAAEESNLPSDREHVNEFILRSDQFKKGNFVASKDHSSYRLTIDDQRDFEVIEFLIKRSQISDNYQHYIYLLDQNPEIKAKNSAIKRNEGMLKSWEKDKLFIKNN